MFQNLSKDEVLTGIALIGIGALIGGSVIKIMTSRHNKKIEKINDEMIAVYSKLLDNARTRDECYIKILDGRFEFYDSLMKSTNITSTCRREKVNYGYNK